MAPALQEKLLKKLRKKVKIIRKKIKKIFKIRRPSVKRDFGSSCSGRNPNPKNKK